MGEKFLFSMKASNPLVMVLVDVQFGVGFYVPFRKGAIASAGISPLHT